MSKPPIVYKPELTGPEFAQIWNALMEQPAKQVFGIALKLRQVAEQTEQAYLNPPGDRVEAGNDKG